MANPLLDLSLNRPARAVVSYLIEKTREDSKFTFSIADVMASEKASRQMVGSILQALEDGGYIDRYESRHRHVNRFRVVMGE